jgi:hypothetical protein
MVSKKAANAAIVGMAKTAKLGAGARKSALPSRFVGSLRKRS